MGRSGMSNIMKPLRVLEPWMMKKLEAGLGMSAMDGNGMYFLDFETLKFYSPWDDELEGELDREFEFVDGKLTGKYSCDCCLEQE